MIASGLEVEGTTVKTLVTLLGPVLTMADALPLSTIPTDELSPSGRSFEVIDCRTSSGRCSPNTSRKEPVGGYLCSVTADTSTSTLPKTLIAVRPRGEHLRILLMPPPTPVSATSKSNDSVSARLPTRRQLTVNARGSTGLAVTSSEEREGADAERLNV